MMIFGNGRLARFVAMIHQDLVILVTPKSLLEYYLLMLWFSLVLAKAALTMIPGHQSLVI
jgi:predicted ATPase